MRDHLRPESFWPNSVATMIGAGRSLVTALLLLFSLLYSAQAYPTRTVQLVVPFSAGSTLDILARLIGEKLSARWGQNVIVENRPGVAGTATVAKSPNDGYTLMLASNGHSAVGFVHSKLSFDPVRDFSGVAQVATGPLVMVIDPKLPQTTLAEFIAYARQNPGVWNFATHGYGSTNYTAAVSFNDVAGVNIVHVPYKGAPEALIGVVRGDSQLYFAGPNFVKDFVATGRLRALAVTGSERLASAPDVPTVEEAGLKGFSYKAWIGIFAPAGTPEHLRDQISSELRSVMDLPDFRDALSIQGLTVVKGNPRDLDQLVQEEVSSLERLLKRHAN